MNEKSVIVDPFICPLCERDNACVNLTSADVDKSCWCNDPSLTFPKELLAQVAEQLKGKACICKACALAYQTQQVNKVKGS